MKRRWHIRFDREPLWSHGWRISRHENMGDGITYGWRWMQVWWTRR